MPADGLHGAGTDATYDRAGFGASVPRGPRPALVVVDLTRGFTEPGFASGADLSRQVAATAAARRGRPSCRRPGDLHRDQLHPGRGRR